MSQAFPHFRCSVKALIHLISVNIIWTSLSQLLLFYRQHEAELYQDSGKAATSLHAFSNMLVIKYFIFPQNLKEKITINLKVPLSNTLFEGVKKLTRLRNRDYLFHWAGRKSIKIKQVVPWNFLCHDTGEAWECTANTLRDIISVFHFLTHSNLSWLSQCPCLHPCTCYLHNISLIACLPGILVNSKCTCP